MIVLCYMVSRRVFGRENVDLVLNQCRTTAVEVVADEKPYSGVKLRLHVLMRKG
jgi:hypothetical protein